MSTNPIIVEFRERWVDTPEYLREWRIDTFLKSLGPGQGAYPAIQVEHARRVLVKLSALTLGVKK